MKAQVTVSVNGQSVQQFVSQQRSKEIQSFLFQELRSLSRGIRRYDVTNNSSHSKVKQLGNGSIRCA